MGLIAPDDPRLKRRAALVGRVSKAERYVFNQMYETMVLSCGIGIAAPQVGIMKRMFIGLRFEDRRAFYFAVDPVIVAASDEMHLCEEGCLSFPGQAVTAPRHSWIVMRWRNLSNKIVTARLEGLASVCAQHEIDHLDGITMHMRAARP